MTSNSTVFTVSTGKEKTAFILVLVKKSLGLLKKRLVLVKKHDSLNSLAPKAYSRFKTAPHYLQYIIPNESPLGLRSNEYNSGLHEAY